MTQNSSQRFHFRLHYCECDNHYHIILGPENISWPFWSFEAGLKLVDFYLSGYDPFNQDFDEGDLDPEKLLFTDGQLCRIRQEILAAARIANIPPGGQLGEECFRMPREMLPQEENVAIFWSGFLRGEINHVCYRPECATGPENMPLYCDFVQRCTGKPMLEIPSSEWETLAKGPVTRRTLEEIGISLVSF